jgi:hypothetical protein
MQDPDRDLMIDYNDYRHEYDGWDDGPIDPLCEDSANG